MDDESLKWHWSYQQQLNILDSSDGYWVTCARNRWKSPKDLDEFRKLLTSYSLLRGKVASYFSKQRNTSYFIARCNRIFAEPITGNVWHEAQARWDQFNSEFKEIIGTTPASAAMKVFWFYHPKKLTMYDQYVLKSLSRRVEGKIGINNYLMKFGAYYKNYAYSRIKEIEKHFPRKYISRPRIADKYLWLEGNQNKEAILRNYRHGLKLAKIKH